MAGRRLMTPYVAVMAGLLGAFYGLPKINGVEYNNVAWTLVGLTSAAAVVAGIVRNRPRRKAPWVLLALSLLMFIAGDTLYNVYTDIVGWADPFPSAVDVLYQIYFALVFVALLVLPRADASRDRSAILDALTVTASVGLLAWVLLIGPMIESTQHGTLEKWASISLILWDVLILATGTRLISTVRRTPTMLLLTVGVAGMLISDVLYALGQLGDTWTVGGPADLGWFILYAAWGAAALHPSMRSLTEQRTVWSSEVSMRRVAVLTVACLVAPAVILVEARTGGELYLVEDAEAIAVMSALIFLLVLLRLARVVRTHREALARGQGLAEASPAFVSATSTAEVTAAVQAAVARLLPPHTAHQVLLRVIENPDEAKEPAHDGVTLVPTGSFDAHTAAAMGSFATTLVRSLHGAGADRRAASPVVGELLVSAQHDVLVSLRGPMEVLGSQAALALERIALSDEITRRNSEEYFRTLVHNTADVILIVNDDNRIRYSSPSTTAVFGRESLVGMLLAEVVDPQDQDAARKVLDLARAGHGGDANWTVLNAAGRRMQVEVSCRDLRNDRTVRGLVVTLRDVTERRRLERELTHRASHDSLTGLANRVLFAERVQQAVSQSAWNGGVVGVVFIDLDDFKVVNDTLGHEMGDELLVRVARKLASILRSNDLAARLGGDEFAALIEDARDTDDIELVAGRMVEIFAQPFTLDGAVVTVSASIGVATTLDAADGRDLLRQADLALYVAKGAGKAQWRRYQSAIHTAIVERLALRSELDQAIADEALALRYQPIVSLSSGHTVGFEALVRWHHPTRGLVLPNQFIDVAEESGLIVPIGNWVLERALATAAEWHNGLLRDGPPDATVPHQVSAAYGGIPNTSVPNVSLPNANVPYANVPNANVPYVSVPNVPNAGVPNVSVPYVSVNVSARQFRMPDFADRVRRQLATVGLPPAALMLEITESLLLRDDDQVWSDLRALRRTGVRIAIDDFGTGYSSLSYLRQVPVDVVKIDRSFIDTMSSSPQQRALVEGIVGLADTLNLQVVAEGIERDTDRELLSAIGCPLGQGYLFSEPLTDKDAARRLIGERE